VGRRRRRPKEETMTTPHPHRVIGAELSPYSVKVRSYFRFKGIPHDWIVRTPDTQSEFQKYAKLPLIPLVVTPEDEGMQDSTPIIERLEAEHPEPSIHPSDPVARFVSAILEEFGDEWGNKWMFHFRWAREIDRLSSAGRIARTMMPTADEEQHAGIRSQIVNRMVDRVWFVGSNEQTAPQIEESFYEGLALLEAHLAGRAYLFGDRPAFGDFGVWGQVYNAWTDPTIGAHMETLTPNTLAWVQRMLWPRVDGDFEPWSKLSSTLMPLLESQVGRLFLPWSVANAAAIADGSDEFSVDLGGRTWTQKPQKYHARSLKALREKYAALEDTSAIDEVLAKTGCLEALRG
jgi:glutathione S-transferase